MLLKRARPLVVMLAMLLAVFIISACSSPTPAPTPVPPTVVPPTAVPPTAAPKATEPPKATTAPTTAPTTATSGSGSLTKEAVAEQLKKEGATLNFYWPSGGSVLMWIQDKLIPGYKQYIKQTYGVDMTVNVLSSGGGDAAFFQKLTAYEQANPNGGKDFDIDLVRVVPAVDLLSAGEKGWFTYILPEYGDLLKNLANVNKPGMSAFTLNGKVYAVPVYQPTISFFYNKDKVPNPPQSVGQDLLAWAKANPKKFSYEDPRASSGIGSGAMFMLTVMKTYGDPDKPDSYGKGFDFLKQLQDYVYPQPTESAAAIEAMKRGDVWLMAFWNDFGLSTARDQKITYLANYIPKEGTPVRNTPIAVPRSAAHKMAGLLFVDFALSDSIQKELALTTQQIPASTSQSVWKDMPDTAFGFPYDYIASHTFAAFNSQANLVGIKTMVDQFPQKVLGK